jgi:cob(I)alamin adenosyltransferase
LHALRRFPEITLEQFGDPGWVYRDKLKPHQIEQARAGLARGRAVLAAGQHQIVVLDEINMAIWFGLIALEDVLDLIDHKPPQIELVLTGRRAHEAVIARADLVTEMREIKHTYQVNIPARYGIEH